MDFILGQQLSVKLRLHICTCLLMGAILAVSGEKTLDSLYQKDSSNSRDFQTLWEVYILPRLEYDLNRKYGNSIEWAEDNVSDFDNYPDIPNAQSERQENERPYQLSMLKRNVAGLGNLDRMMSILDSRKKLPLQVNGGVSKLQMLMKAHGRK